MHSASVLTLLTTCREDFLVHLNYAITLYNAGKQRAATKQYSMFDSLLKKQHPDIDSKKKKVDRSIDPEVCVCVCVCVCVYIHVCMCM